MKKKDMITSKNTAITFLSVLILMSFSIHAQSDVVEGNITTYKTIAVKNAKVTVKKTKKETFTDALGHFKIECTAKDKLIVSALGFKSKTYKVKNSKDSLNINIDIDGEESDIDLAFSNGHLSKKDAM